jgi:hypothetical protein
MFSVSFVSEAYPEEDSVCGTLWLQQDIVKNNFVRLIDAITHVERVVHGDVNYHDAVSFEISYLQIYDDKNRRVLAAYNDGDHFKWVKPVYDEITIARLKRRQEKFNIKARLQTRYIREPEILELMLTDLYYKDHKLTEIINKTLVKNSGFI